MSIPQVPPSVKKLFGKRRIRKVIVVPDSQTADLATVQKDATMPVSPPAGVTGELPVPVVPESAAPMNLRRR